MCSDRLRITLIRVLHASLFLSTAFVLNIHANKPSVTSRNMVRFSPEEASAQIAILRSQQQIESCKILFEFVHRIEGNVQVTKTQGVLLIDSKDQQIFKRLFLNDEQGKVLVDYIFHEGETTKVWKRFGSQGAFTELGDGELFLPIKDII